jgi:hypothetical protein
MKGAKLWRGVVSIGAVWLLAACNLSDESVVVNQNAGQPDTGFNVEEGDVETNQNEPELPSEASEWCAAGGVVTGPGVRLVHCTAPASASGPTLQGDGVRLQPGASRVLLP